MRRWQSINRLPKLGFLGIVAAALAAAWMLWAPGIDARDGRNDRGANGIVLSAGWVADDAWFSAGGREGGKARFRDPLALRDLVRKARQHGIADVFIELPAMGAEGRFTGVDPERIEKLLYECYGLRVMPRVVGSALPLGDARWRSFFIRDVQRLLDRHPRFPGVQLALADARPGDASFLQLLDELRIALPSPRVLSIAVPADFEAGSLGELAKRADQLVVPHGPGGFISKLHVRAVAARTAAVLAACEGKPVLFAITPEDSLRATLRGIHLGLAQANAPAHFQGVAMDATGGVAPEAWLDFHDRFVKP